MIFRLLPVEEQAIALHEAGHAVVAELLGWPVLSLRLSDGHAGLCKLQGSAPAPWVNVAVSAAGHAVEKWYFGRVIEAPSEKDREEAQEAFETAGMEELASPWAVREIESQMWPLFSCPRVKRAVYETAQALVIERRLSRNRFLETAVAALELSRLARRAQRFCEGLAVRVLESRLEEVE